MNAIWYVFALAAAAATGVSAQPPAHGSARASPVAPTPIPGSPTHPPAGPEGGPFPAIPPLRVQASAIADRDDLFARLVVQDESTDRVLIDRVGRHALWGPGDRTAPSLRPTLDLIPRPDGFDLIARYHNTTPHRRSPGILYLPGIHFPRVVRARDLYVDAKPRTIDRGAGGGTYFGGGNVYPGSAYAPVFILGDDDYTIGVSLLYPVLDYQHRVFIRAEVPYAAGGSVPQTWQLRFELNPGVSGGAPPSPEGDLAPGERREYRLCVRVAHRSASEDWPHGPQHWLALLEPYRLYYSHLYGPVEYARDPRPVQGVAIAYPGSIAPDNPYGFVGHWTRPDLHGWSRWAFRLREASARRWDRFMLWAPSGLFTINRAFNYPFQFTSGWQRETLTRDTLGHLLDFAREPRPGEPRELGLWWGHSANYHKTWEPEEEPLLDPDDPDHRAAIHRELDGAAAVGATMIGLDTFPRLPEWRSLPYLAALRQRYPGMRFLVEPMPCDVLHRVAAGFIWATRPASQLAFRVENPHLLADFLNPGHETWGGVQENDIRAEIGLGTLDPLPRDRVIDALRRTAALGYVPAAFTSIGLDDDEPSSRAVPTWLDTVPGPRPPAAAPAIVASPAPFEGLPGDTVVLRAAATGSDLAYRWRRDGQWLTGPGTDTAELVLAPLRGSDAGVYECVASNFLGEAASRPAIITVGCQTDFNQDGSVDADDLGDFITAYFWSIPPDPRCDINRDGSIDADDLGTFLNVYFLGC